jgi:O-acetyl-ADP-ribose deacetylase (regulator of RNase III)
MSNNQKVTKLNIKTFPGFTVQIISKNCSIINSFFEVEVVMGDITEEKTDAIVNPANSNLAHSGGAAAAILREGGTKVQQESVNIISVNGPIKTGDCVYTGAGKLENLGVKFIIHAVGPVFN